MAVLALNCSPLPAVEETKLPLVAVTSPKVAVRVVVAVNAPAWLNVNAFDVPRVALFEITNRSLALLSKPIVIVEAPTPLIWNETYGSPVLVDPPTANCSPALPAAAELSELVICIFWSTPALL